VRDVTGIEIENGAGEARPGGGEAITIFTLAETPRRILTGEPKLDKATSRERPFRQLPAHLGHRRHLQRLERLVLTGRPRLRDRIGPTGAEVIDLNP
jgi:hypothetical protein